VYTSVCVVVADERLTMIPKPISISMPDIDTGTWPTEDNPKLNMMTLKKSNFSQKKKQILEFNLFRNFSSL
jgi:hypothetical protein